MAKTVKYYEQASYTEIESRREYEQIGSVTNVTSHGYGTYSKTRTDLYLDPATGLVVADIEAYEKWVS